MIYKTRNLQMSAALTAQKEFDVFYMELQATAQYNKFEFIFEVDAQEEIFNTWVLDYMNRKICIEPKTYDDALGSLRDIINYQKSKLRTDTQNPTQ